MSDWHAVVDLDSRGGAAGSVTLRVVGNVIELGIVDPGAPATSPAARCALNVNDGGMLFDALAGALRALLDARDDRLAGLAGVALQLTPADTPQDPPTGPVSGESGRV